MTVSTDPLCATGRSLASLRARARFGAQRSDLGLLRARPARGRRNMRPADRTLAADRPGDYAPGPQLRLVGSPRAEKRATIGSVDEGLDDAPVCRWIWSG